MTSYLLFSTADATSSYKGSEARLQSGTSRRQNALGDRPSASLDSRCPASTRLYPLCRPPIQPGLTACRR
ncbi:hypothetical protein VTO73DRAFT_12358 [Trametes versicolor]